MSLGMCGAEVLVRNRWKSFIAKARQAPWADVGGDKLGARNGKPGFW
jgi:hypothetical protein